MSFMEQVLGLQNPNGCKALENIAYFYQVKGQWRNHRCAVQRLGFSHCTCCGGLGDIPMMINYLRRALFTYRKVYGNQFSKSNELRWVAPFSGPCLLAIFAAPLTILPCSSRAAQGLAFRPHSVPPFDHGRLCPSGKRTVQVPWHLQGCPPSCPPDMATRRNGNSTSLQNTPHQGSHQCKHCPSIPRRTSF